MIRTILFLEDNGYLVKQTKRFLEDDGFQVISCARIDLAQKRLNDENLTVDCIITDLNMNDEWLKEYRGESCGGLLSGWVWLRRFVYGQEKYKSLPGIVYSGYIQELESYLDSNGELYLLTDLPVKLVRKGGNSDNGYMTLLKTLQEINEELLESEREEH